ncbi:MAG: hypothetical protein NVSMB9_23600 [Isosphaeraceae bacterium]
MPRFVLLEHCWNGVHWDLMLEIGSGAPLRTWAIDAPIVSGQDLPARALAEHRALYLEFEGALSGGRGTVRRVDGGEYESKVWAPDLVRVELRGNQLVGIAELRKAVEGAGCSEEGRRPRPTWIFRLGNLD